MMCVTPLKWAREHHVPFRLRSGRHSYENFSLLNRGLIIDVSEMKQITVNTGKLTATIEAGANLGTVYKELWNTVLQYQLAQVQVLVSLD